MFIILYSSIIDHSNHIIVVLLNDTLNITYFNLNNYTVVRNNSLEIKTNHCKTDFIFKSFQNIMV